MTLKIALLQLLPGKTLQEQLRLGSAACERAKALGADIALFHFNTCLSVRYRTVL